MITCWFQNDDVFKLQEIPEEYLVNKFGDYFDPDSLLIIIENVFNLYNYALNEMNDCINANYEISDAMQVFVDQISIDKGDGTFDFEIVCENEQDCETICQYLEKWNGLSTSYENYIEAKNFVYDVDEEDEKIMYS